MNTDMIGLPLTQALKTVAPEHRPMLVFADAPRAKQDVSALTPRVVRMKGDTWLVSHFRDGDPKEP